MGLAKQNLMESHNKARIDEKVSELAEHWGMDDADVRIMCLNAAGQRGVSFEEQVLTDHDTVDLIVQYHRACDDA